MSQTPERADSLDDATEIMLATMEDYDFDDNVKAIERLIEFTGKQIEHNKKRREAAIQRARRR